MIKLLLFPFSLEGEARIWLDKEPSRSILTWEYLVSKFINQFFPPSKTTYLRNETTNFLQKPNETFNEAWERFKDLLRQCPHHGFSELHQLDTFYNALNPNDQDALDSAAGGNFLDKIPRECLSIIESKSKVRYSRSRETDSRANTNAPLSSSLPSNSFDLQQIAASLEDKLDIRMNRFEKSLNDTKASFVTPTAPIKAVEEVCVTCGANHSYNHCPLTRGNKFPIFHDNIQQFQTAAVDFVVLDFIADPRVPLILGRPFLNSPFNMEEDILFLEGLLNEDLSPPLPMIPNQTKFSIKEHEHSFSMGYEHFSTTLVTKKVTESSTKNLVPIPRECEVTLNNGSESIQPVKDDSLVFMTFSNPLFNNDEINSDELESHVESNFVEFTSNHDTVKFDNLDEFSGPFIPIYIAEEERIRMEHADYINPIQNSDSQREEIDIVTSTDDVLPSDVENDDSNGEVDAVDDLRVDNSISNSEHKSSESEDSDFDNPSVPLPPPEPPDKEFDFEIYFGDEISVVRNTIVKF
nr:reverse transcriptase domain-containing protein [Tanacetum cinerariifolium]